MGYFGYDQGGVGQLFTLALAQQCLWQFWSVPHCANSCGGACPSRPVGAQFWMISEAHMGPNGPQPLSL